MSKKMVLLGLGLDTDGHTRITRGDNFTILGGTKDTHECMQEQAIKFNEKLSKKGKPIEQLSHQEVRDLLHESAK